VCGLVGTVEEEWVGSVVRCGGDEKELIRNRRRRRTDFCF
jgi:hypothetical protein